MTNEKLQDYFEINNNNKLIDVKISLGNAVSAPSQILSQVKTIVKADQDGLLNNFVDF